MCGITGFIDCRTQADREALHAMTECLHHRGPDDKGSELHEAAGCLVGLGFRRLAIIDLSPSGHQPMHSADGVHTIILNGEIYNYREIRTALEKLGSRFRSSSDTEVAMEAYRVWGKKCVEKFIGMFALAILDRQKQEVIFFRDRAGVKPFYYYFDQGLFLFGSELKAFHQHPGFRKAIDMDALSLYFQHGYIPAPHSIFKHTFKLLPGHLLTFSLEKKDFIIEKYWDVADYYRLPKLTISYPEALEETEKILQSAFEYRMVADVPVGVFLSGGYDSSLVTALIQKNSASRLKTYTIGFSEEAFNEAVHAKKVADHLGTDHQEYTCTYREAMDVIPMLPSMYDEPFADSSAIPTYLVSKMARKEVTVALSADGGDETFAGYTKYEKGSRYIRRMESLPQAAKYLGESIAGLYGAFNTNGNLAVADRAEKLKLALGTENAAKAFNVITQSMTQKEVRLLLKPEIHFPGTFFEEAEQLVLPELLDHFLCLDYKTYMVDDILQKVDRATMAVSLEGREPLLDHRIIEWAARLPSEFKLHQGKGKRIIRDIVHRYIPAEVMDRPKMGFQVPVAQWMKNEQKDILLKYTDKKELLKTEIFNSEKVERLVNSYIKGDIEDFHRIWKILMFQMWFEKWMIH